MITFIGLNPSTADATKDDSTIRKCRGFAERLGHTAGPHGILSTSAIFSRCGRYRHKLRRPGMTMLNLFDYRSTDPRGLLAAWDRFEPISTQLNERFPSEDVEGHTVVAAWGGPHGNTRLQGIIAERARDVLRDLAERGIAVMCLGVTKRGHPRHPLFVPYDTPLRPMVMP